MKIVQIEYARAFASIAVVIFHIQITFQKYFGFSLWDGFLSGNSGVQIFFVLSGLVMFYIHDGDKENSSRAISRFAYKRFERIYVPLWIVLLPLTVVVAQESASWLDIILAWTVLPSPSDPVLAVEWTLRHEVLFYFFFALFIYNRRIGFVLLLLWGGVGSLAGAFFIDPWLLKFIFHPNHLLFLLGMGVAYVWRSKAYTGYGWQFVVLGFVLFAAAWAWDAFYIAPKSLIVFGYGIGFSVFFLGCLQGNFLGGRSYIGLILAESSYAIYLLHFPIIVICCKFLSRFDIVEGFLAWVLASATAIISIGGGIVFNALVERPVLRFLKSRHGRPKLAGR